MLVITLHDVGKFMGFVNNILFDHTQRGLHKFVDFIMANIQLIGQVTQLFGFKYVVVFEEEK